MGITSDAQSHEELRTHVEPLRVILADDDPLARRIVRDALQRANVIVVAEAQNGYEAVELSAHYQPDVVVLDVVMPDIDGIVATRRILKQNPGQLIVLLTSADEDEMGMLGLRAGAVGFLSKDLDLDMLPGTLHGARAGEAVVSPRLAMRLVDYMRSTPQGFTGMRPLKSPLTSREWEVVDLLHEGMSPTEVADTLVVSAETIRTHVKNIMRKLDVRTRAEAVEVAQRIRGGMSAG